MGIVFSNIKLAKTQSKQHSDKIRETVFVSEVLYGNNQTEFVLKTIKDIISQDGESIVHTSKYNHKLK